jgi:Flp pilus assembly protein TadG
MHVLADRKRGKRRRHKSAGQAVVEFALVIPIFLFIFWGVIDFGFMLFSRMSVINAAREGARAASVATDPSTIPVLVPSAVVSSGAGLVAGDISVTVTCRPVVSGSCNFAAAANSKPGDAVVVTVNYPYHTFFPMFFGSTMNLSSTVQMTLEY